MTKNNQSVAKALQIIEIMAAGNGPMRLQDISTRVQLPGSTVLRFLGTLMAYHYVTQDKETLQYALTMKFCRLGHLVSSQVHLRDVVRPYLIRLADQFGESASLAVEEEQNVLYIDCVDGPDHMLQTLQRIGRVAPMNGTGVGKLLLLRYGEIEIDRFVAERGLEASTVNTITEKAPLLRELRKIARVGYAIDNEECELGVKCVAAPIRDYTGEIVAAISMSGPVSRMTADRINLVKEGITQTAAEISTSLGFVPGTINGADREAAPRTARSAARTARSGAKV